MPEPTVASFIISEMRRQVDHQITAATSLDTKAAALLAGTFALAAVVVPRVVLDTPTRSTVAFLTFVSVIGTLYLFTRAIEPRIKGFSYGPAGEDMVAMMKDHESFSEVETEVADAYVDVRSVNEKVMAAKAGALIQGIGFLILTVFGLGAMVVAGAIA